jgi:hypothetical protein
MKGCKIWNGCSKSDLDTPATYNAGPALTVAQRCKNIWSHNLARLQEMEEKAARKQDKRFSFRIPSPDLTQDVTGLQNYNFSLHAV